MMVKERGLYQLCVFFYRENFCIIVTIPAPFILLVITPLKLVLLFCVCVCVTIGFEFLGNNRELYYVRMGNYDNGKRPTREKRKTKIENREADERRTSRCIYSLKYVAQIQMY